MTHLIVYGTGNGADKFAKAINKAKVDILTYADSDYKKVNAIYKGKYIISPEQIQSYKYDYIVIASIYYNEISNHLITLGIESNKILSFFDFDNYEKYNLSFNKILSLKGKIKRSIEYKRISEDFNPTIYSIFTNPFYIIRKALYKCIKEKRNYMKGKMLDFGCGRKPYKRFFNVEEYVGLDIEQSGHSHQNEEIDVFYDGQHIPFENEYFDSIFSSEVIEHVFDLKSIIKELNRVLKVDGHILVTVPFVWDEHEIPYDFGRYTSFGIKHIFESSGFEVISLEKSNNYIAAMFQMWSAYVFELLPKNKTLRFMMSIIFIFPSNLLGIVLSKLLPDNRRFYNNNILVAKKILQD
jgi:Methylase involved in ubiquinone/menaquinone biosynthesis